MPHWRGAIAGGIWQPVSLVATNPEFLSDVFVEPDILASRAVVHAVVMNSRTRSTESGTGTRPRGNGEPVEARNNAAAWRQRFKTRYADSGRAALDAG